MQPFRVRISLKTPMVEPRRPIYLDGLLSGLRVAQDETVHWEKTQHDLPLERFETGAGWCFKASAFQVKRLSSPMPWMLTGRINLVKAAEDRASGLLKLRAAMPNTSGGPFKSSKFSIDLIRAELTAWGVGDVDAVRELLSKCDQVGGRRSGAHGQVDSISVEAVDEGDCKWFLRSLPHDTRTEGMGVEFVCEAGNLKAPYWKQVTQEIVLVPVTA